MPPIANKLSVIFFRPQLHPLRLSRRRASTSNTCRETIYITATTYFKRQSHKNFSELKKTLEWRSEIARSRVFLTWARKHCTFLRGRLATLGALVWSQFAKLCRHISYHGVPRMHCNITECLECTWISWSAWNELEYHGVPGMHLDITECLEWTGISWSTWNDKKYRGVPRILRITWNAQRYRGFSEMPRNIVECLECTRISQCAWNVQDYRGEPGIPIIIIVCMAY